MTGVVIRGGGTAACCCAHLLRNASVKVAVQPGTRAGVPAVMLSDAAVALIQDVFEDPDLFHGAHRIRKRVVAWGRNEEPRVLEHSAVVVSEEKLLAGLSARSDAGTGDFEAGWTVLSSRPLPAVADEQRFGSRRASAVRVTLRNSADSSTCWIESLEYGWLFLIPISTSTAWLLSVGEPTDALLASSRLIRPQLLGISSASGEFPAYPRIISPLCGPGWLACGTAAMAFDPICGDGTAHAIREAILAAAVIRAADAGEDTAQLFSHYNARLTAGFERHLRLCRDFYRTGYGGPWWDTERELLENGIAWCTRKAASATEFRYRLSGFELKAAMRAAS